MNTWGCGEHEGVMVRAATTGITAMTEHSGSEEGMLTDTYFVEFYYKHDLCDNVDGADSFLSVSLKLR